MKLPGIRVTKRLERLHFFISGDTGDDVAGEGADDERTFGIQPKSDDHCPSHRNEGIAIEEAKRCQPMAAPTKIHNFVERKQLRVSLKPQITRAVVTIGCGYVKSVLGAAKNRILLGDEFPGERLQP